MKKRFVSFLIVLLSITAAQAQRLNFGGKISANMTKIDGVKFKSGYELNYQLGVFAEIDITKGIGIQPEVLFSQTSSRVDSGFSAVYQNAGNALLNRNVKLNYLNIPVLLRLNAGQLLTLTVGPQFSVLVNDRENLVQNGKDAFKKGDLAAVLGAQINISKLRIYGRYNIGLSNINDIDNSNKWKSQQLQFGVGVTIL